jgi:formylglycine-generating enzyme required for sulfatase activity
MKIRTFLFGAIALAGSFLLPARGDAPPKGMVLIPQGFYEPLFRAENEPARVPVAPFYLDVKPVTNREFLEFVRANPQWQRSHVVALFADNGYLGSWAGDLELGPQALEDSPVVRVSWFAAKAYAVWRGVRLPTTAEWERAANVGFTHEDGRTESEYRDAALAWFAQPTPAHFAEAGSGRPNLYGVRDMLTLVWEWVDDFNTAMVSGESRSDTSLDRALFCGAAAANARDLTNYPAFMRAGYRSSLRASYVVPNLGFRCAKDVAPDSAKSVATVRN